MGLWLGQHRKLHELHIVQRLIQRGERSGIDHVFRIVQQHHAERLAAARLVFAKRSVEAIEAIGLGGRPLAIMDHDAQPLIAPGHPDNRLHRLVIVAVAADIEP